MIPLNDKWFLSFSETSVDVYERKINQKTGEPYVTPRFYYPNLETALQGLVDRSLTDELTSLEMVVDKINELKRYIHAFCEKNDLLKARSLNDLYKVNGKGSMASGG